MKGGKRSHHASPTAVGRLLKNQNVYKMAHPQDFTAEKNMIQAAETADQVISIRSILPSVSASQQFS